MDYIDIPIEVVYTDILPYLDIMSLYNISHLNTSIYKIYRSLYNKMSNKDRTLFALEVEDVDMIRECKSEWIIPYSNEDPTLEFYKSIFDIARKKRSIDIICVLIEGYEHLCLSGYLVYDVEFVSLLYNDSRTREYIKNHIISRFIGEGEVAESTITKYITEVRDGNPRFRGMNPSFTAMCLCLSIVTDLTDMDDLYVIYKDDIKGAGVIKKRLEINVPYLFE